MMSSGDFTLVHLQGRLAGYVPRRLSGGDEMAQAAVAMVLRASGGETEILMVRRAEHPDDPWSGHMAFPGGREESSDRSTKQAAIRETMEEVSLNLEESANFIGRLSELQARSRNGALPLCIHPFVFELVGSGELEPNYEVAETVWIPLSFFRDSANRSSFAHTDSQGQRILPAYRYSHRLVWGLSLAMLDELVFRLHGKPVPGFMNEA